MAFNISVVVVFLLIGLWYYRHQKKNKNINEGLEESLKDETIFVQGRGRIKFEDLHDMVNGDPNEGVKEVKDTMFREDLMRFEGEFLIEGLPLNEERRLSIDDAFLYLQELFDEDILSRKPALSLIDTAFPTNITAHSEIIPLAKTIARIMDIDPESIAISFFRAPKDHEEKSAAGIYHGKNNRGMYEVALIDDLHQDMERLIATISHEFAHIKLLGEGRMTENSEELTDMVPLIYGFGLFNANTSFKTSKDNKAWMTSKLGYLSQVDWAYLFALYLYACGEENPQWFNYLNKTIAKDCSKAMAFIKANPDKVLQPLQG